jgi:hypothetical protein
MVEMKTVNMPHQIAASRWLGFPELVVIVVIVGVILLLRFRRR